MPSFESELGAVTPDGKIVPASTLAPPLTEAEQGAILASARAVDSTGRDVTAQVEIPPGTEGLDRKRREYLMRAGARHWRVTGCFDPVWAVNGAAEEAAFRFGAKQASESGGHLIPAERTAEAEAEIVEGKPA